MNVKEFVKDSLDFTGYQSCWENLSQTEFDIEIPENLPDARGYFNRLVSVLSNLLLNAYQAMTEADLTGSRERLIKIRACFSEDNADIVEIKVSNKGPLIPEEEMDKIFRQGHSTKEGNKGMGLDIAKTQVEVFHNGKISVKNIEGFGPEFTVSLPIWKEKSEK